MNGLSDKQIGLYINSKNRTTGTSNSNFTIRLRDTIKNVKSIMVKSVEIPVSYYATSSTKIISVTKVSDSTTYTANVASGTYDAETFAAALETAINGTGFTGFTIAFSEITQKYTIANAVNFLINSATTLTAELGFAGNTTTSATSWTSDNIINVSGTNHIFIMSSKLNSLRRQQYADNQTRNIFFKLVVDEPYGAVISYKKREDEASINYYDRLFLDVIDFQLVDEDFNEISLNGLPWNIEFDITTLN